MAAGSLSSRFSSMSFLTIGVLSKISSAGVSLPSTVPTMRWQTTARNVPASCRRICSRSSALKKSRMRLMDCDAFVVCKRGQDQMPGVRRAHRGRETDVIAHFADHDDVRVLAQNVYERVMKGQRIQADFALFDDRLVVFKNVFNRVFERDDVLFEIVVDVLDHGRERGGFAAAGGTGHQHDAARRFRDLLDLLQQTQVPRSSARAS